MRDAKKKQERFGCQMWRQRCHLGMRMESAQCVVTLQLSLCVMVMISMMMLMMAAAQPFNFSAFIICQMIWAQPFVFSRPATAWYDLSNAFHLQKLVLLWLFHRIFTLMRKYLHMNLQAIKQTNKHGDVNSAHNELIHFARSNVCQWKMLWKIDAFFFIQMNKIVNSFSHFLSRARPFWLLFYQHEKIITMWKVYLLGWWWLQWAASDYC